VIEEVYVVVMMLETLVVVIVVVEMFDKHLHQLDLEYLVVLVELV
jgi:hypothetical protein